MIHAREARPDRVAPRQGTRGPMAGEEVPRTPGGNPLAQFGAASSALVSRTRPRLPILWLTRLSVERPHYETRRQSLGHQGVLFWRRALLEGSLRLGRG